MGLEGLFSELNVRNMDRLSGVGGAFALLAKVVPPALPRYRRIAFITSVYDLWYMYEAGQRRLEAKAFSRAHVFCPRCGQVCLIGVQNASQGRRSLLSRLDQLLPVYGLSAVSPSKFEDLIRNNREWSLQGGRAPLERLI